MDKFNHVLDLMDEIIEREIEIEHVFDITKAELSALRVIADAARAVHDVEVVWGSHGYGAARVDVVTWNVLAAALDTYDALEKEQCG